MPTSDASWVRLAVTNANMSVRVFVRVRFSGFMLGRLGWYTYIYNIYIYHIYIISVTADY